MIKYKIGDVVTGNVTGIEDYGVFVSFDDNYTGLIHISELSESFVKNVSDFAKIGGIIKSRIIDIDYKKNHLKLSVKNLYPGDIVKKGNHINETKSGFSTLNYKLNEWINEKKSEIYKNNKKN